MKRKLAGLIISFLLILSSLLWSGLRSRVKQYLPRSGDVEIAGGIYTPYLLENSPLYFLKEWEESFDLLLVSERPQKAYLKLTYANKRLLEVERITREGNTDRVKTLMQDFSTDYNEAISFAEASLQYNEKIEKFVWFFQESIQDQQIVFELIYNRLPESDRQEFINIQKKSVDDADIFLDKAYGFDRKEV